MAGDEVGLARADQVRRADGARPEPQVGGGHRTRLLRVVDEVPLRVEVGTLPDDLHRALVGAHRPVGAEPVEHGPHDVVGLRRERAVDLERGVRDVVDDADREVVLRLILRELVEDGLGHRRIELLRGEAVASADHPRHHGEGAGRDPLGECGDDVLVQRLAGRPGLLRPVEHGDRPHGGRERPGECLVRRTGGRAGRSRRRPSRRRRRARRRSPRRRRRPSPSPPRPARRRAPRGSRTGGTHGR